MHSGILRAWKYPADVEGLSFQFHKEAILAEQIKPQQPANWDLYRALREQWTHEDNLANHRVMWLTISQGLLLTVFGSVLPMIHRWFVMVGFPIFGMVVSSVIGISIYASLNATDSIRKQYDQAGLNQFCSLAPSGRTRFLGNLAARSLPFVFLIVWVLALIAALVAE